MLTPSPIEAEAANPAQATFRILQDIAADLSQREVTFPTFANATMKIRHALADPKMDAERLARVISAEPLLAARLVHIANSAALNPSGARVGDVKTAVTRVGFEMVRTVAAGLAMTQLLAADSLRKHATRAAAAWKHSIDVAVIAYVIARKMTKQPPEEALFAGIVHDIGYFYLLSRTGNYPELEAHPQAMDDVLRDWHAPIGQSVLHAYNLSEATLTAVVDHENLNYQRPPRSMSDVIRLANLVTAHTNPIYLTGNVEPPGQPDDPQLFKVLVDSDAEIRSLAATFH